ncbi:MAG: ribosomal RNA small subunit methyltransferase A [Deltaproteobacteria bacterium]|nr:ribosomal RNA small subunit methyltransferase A [Deltaproteobacteria bacterium]
MTSPRTLLNTRNLRAKKHLGQNFLSDPSTALMILERTGIKPDDIVLEIGAGLGALTIPAAYMARKIYAVEKDPAVLDLLKKELSARELANVDLIKGDILRIDINALARQHDARLLVLGNLPYNISSQIIIQMIRSRNAVRRAVIMLQKELAQRLTARPGCKEYGRITAMLQYCADIRKIAAVPANLFFPKPNIDSQVLEITFKPVPDHPAADENLLFSIIKAAFSKRRKTLKNALAGSELSLDAKTAGQLLEKAGIDPVRRAETLEIAEFVELSKNLKP